MQNEKKILSPLKSALVEIEKLRGDVGALREGTKDDIAIISMGCRFPKADNLKEYWDLLVNGIDATDAIPSNRWNIEEFYDPDTTVSGTMNIKRGGFLKDIDKFDATLFGISPREAVSMDPQQRLLLKVVWETLENSGRSIDEYISSSTGVFIGVGNTDYLQFTVGNYDVTSGYSGTGNASCINANRISYTFDFQGPSLSLDTACSSSLVAVHLAINSLRNNESKLAIAGGVNLILSPDGHIAFSKANMMATDGKCKTFDESADGYTRSEGCGVVLLKKLSDAEKDGDNVLAILKGSAVNQDGKSNGITAPNKIAQEKVIKEALDNSRINISDINYIETHGTGTSLGDPIEIQALNEVFKSRSTENKILLGAVKTNVGHLEVASGIAGLIKVVLSLNNELIPKNINFNKINPLINLENSPLELINQNRTWSVGNKKRIASVSSFGFGGTNSHVIIEEYNKKEINEKLQGQDRFEIFTVSANDKISLENYLIRHSEYLDKYKISNYNDYCYTNNTKKQFDYRFATVCDSLNSLGNNIQKYLNDESPLNTFYKNTEQKEFQKIAFMFTGQGSQYANMSKELYDTQPLFRNEIDKCLDILSKEYDLHLRNIIFCDKSNNEEINETVYTQPAIFILQYSLAKLWMSWGIFPNYLIGHSIGEISAAAIAEVISLADALKIVSLRGKLMQQQPQIGKMAVIISDFEDVSKTIKPYEKKISIAAVNGPKNIVISGKEDDINEIVNLYLSKGTKSILLKVSHAFHSVLMEPLIDEFKLALSNIKFNQPKIPLVSNVYGKLIDNDINMDADYWCKHILNPVLFYKGINYLERQNVDIFLEIGPNPILIGMGQASIPSSSAIWLNSLKYGYGDQEVILKSIAELYINGVEINWNNYYQNKKSTKIDVPNYPFNEEKYWLKNAIISKNKKSKTFEDNSLNNELNPLVGGIIDSPFIDGSVIEHTLSLNNLSIIKDHKIYSNYLFPATGFLELVYSNAKKIFDKRIIIRELNIISGIPFKENYSKVQISFSKLKDNKSEFKVFSRKIVKKSENTESEDWNLNAAGVISIDQSNSKNISIDFENLKNSLTEFSLEKLKVFYSTMKEHGFEHGKSMQIIEGIWTKNDYALGYFKLNKNDHNDSKNYFIHPALTDAGTQLIASIFLDENRDNKTEGIFLPVSISNYIIYQNSLHQVWCYVSPNKEKSSKNNIYYNIKFIDENGFLVAEIQEIQFKLVNYKALENLFDINMNNWFYKNSWIEKPINKDEEYRKNKDTVDLYFGYQNTFDSKLNEISTNESKIIISFKSKFEIINSSKIFINPNNKKDYEKLFNYCTNELNKNISSIVFLADTDNINNETTSTEKISKIYMKNIDLILTLTQVLVLSNIKNIPRLFIVINNGQKIDNDDTINIAYSPLIGFSKVTNLEHPELRTTIIDIKNYSEIDSIVYNELNSSESNIAFRNSKRFVNRLDRLQIEDNKNEAIENPVRLEIEEKGLFENLQLVPYKKILPNNRFVEVKVKSSGLNFRDVLNALGLYPGDPGLLGGEFSGIVTAIGSEINNVKVGDEVLGIANGSFGTYVLVHEDLLIIKPKNINFEEASAIPIAFVTSYYTLVKLARISKGDKVLIHAASGGVGLAAIQIAKAKGAIVFGTAGNDEKRKVLAEEGVDLIMDSRSLDFADLILDYTNGYGVDIVLNSFNGEYIEKGLSIMAPNGTFLEIGKIGIWNEEKVKSFKPDIKYHTIAIDDISANNPNEIQSVLKEIINNFEIKEYKPIRNKVYSLENSAKAFSLMRSTKHIGKIVISQKSTENSFKPITIVNNASYLITGGRGALGLSTAKWLIRNGAKHLVLVGRNEPSIEIQEFVEEYKKYNVIIKTPIVDISSYDETKNLFKTIWNNNNSKDENNYLLKGIVHAAGVLDDGILIQQNIEKIKSVMLPKVLGAWNLHLLTEKLELDFMFYYSSISSLFGSPGQVNYSAANSFLDSLAVYRNSLKLPATSINWGAWSDTGMAELNKSKKTVSIKGIDKISHLQGRLSLDKLLKVNKSQVGVIPINWEIFKNQVEDERTSKFFLNFIEPKISDENSIKLETKFIINLKKLQTNERYDFIVKMISDNTKRVLCLNDDHSIKTEKPLSEMGLDSLMGIELKKSLDSILGTNLPATMVFNYPTISAIANYILDEIVELNSDKEEDDNLIESELDINEVDKLSENEVEKLLLKKLGLDQKPN